MSKHIGLLHSVIRDHKRSTLIMLFPMSLKVEVVFVFKTPTQNDISSQLAFPKIVAYRLVIL